MILLGPSASWAQMQPPRLFYSDLISGPNTGGQNGDGTILTIYGMRFGVTRGSARITVGGGPVAAYLAWSDTKVSVAIGSAATTGDVILHASNGESNGVPFTVRPGKVYCVSVSGRDRNRGTFSDGCWATLPHARDKMRPGDITYIENGVICDASDGELRDVALAIDAGGAAGAPLAFVAYPGAEVVIGDPRRLEGILILPRGVSHWPVSHWVFAGLKIVGPSVAMTVDTSITPSVDYRIVGNDFTCPRGNGQTGCYADNFISYVFFYGNQVHDVSSALPKGSSKQYHSVYFSTDANHIDVGWNQIHDDRTCRAIQFHSSPIGPGTGKQQYDLHVHDNIIHDNRCDGINFATVDPSKGMVEAFNNIIYNTGTGPDPYDGVANYTGIYLANILNEGVACSSDCGVHIFNNTFYNNGADQKSVWGAVGANSGPVFPVLQNNIFYETAQTRYIDAGATMACDNNLFYGAGPAPRGCRHAVTADPQFISNFTDFHLQLGSPAIDAGTDVRFALDLDGVIRPQGAAYDIGAYEFVGSAGVSIKKTPSSDQK